MSEEAVAPVEGQPQSEPSMWDSPDFAKFKSPEGTIEYDKLGKSYTELEKMVGSRVPIPAPEALPEEWDKFFDRIAPKDTSAYHLELPGVDDVNAEELDNWKRGFLKAKLIPRQANDIMHMLTQEIVNEQTRTKKANAELAIETESALKQAWGANYEGNKELVGAGLREMGGEDLYNLLSPLLENNSVGAKFLYDVAKELRTSPLMKDAGKGNFGLMTVSEAQAAKMDIIKNPANPLYASYHDRGSFDKRKPAITKMNELNSVIVNSPSFSG